MKEIKDLKMKSSDAVKKLSAEKLIEEIKGAEKTLFTLKMKLAVGEVKQTHLVKVLRRYVASLKTLANQAK